MTVYLDMDGVIADFFGGVERLYGVDHWKSIQHRDGIFVELRNTDFFYRLDTFGEQDRRSDSIKIVNFVKEISDGDWGICSSPLRGDEHNSAYWKRRWLEKWEFTPDIEKLIFTGNKHKYAYNDVTRKPNILIDDKPENIKRWEEAGGIGIRFQCNQDDIEEYLFVELEKALEITRTTTNSS
jgi:hypothetical protein